MFINSPSMLTSCKGEDAHESLRVSYPSLSFDGRFTDLYVADFPRCHWYLQEAGG